MVFCAHANLAEALKEEDPQRRLEIIKETVRATNGTLAAAIAELPIKIAVTSKFRIGDAMGCLIS